MLYILFSLGPARYALAVDRVAEVVPFVEVRPLPQAPEFVLGLMNYRGQPVAVVDLCLQLLGRPCEASLSTRILLVHPDAERPDLILGLVAEKATETQSFSPEEFQEQGLELPEALQLGPVRVGSQEMLQLIRVEKLLTPALRELLQAAAR